MVKTKSRITLKGIKYWRLRSASASAAFLSRVLPKTCVDDDGLLERVHRGILRYDHGPHRKRKCYKVFIVALVHLRPEKNLTHNLTNAPINRGEEEKPATKLLAF